MLGRLPQNQAPPLSASREPNSFYKGEAAELANM